MTVEQLGDVLECLHFNRRLLRRKPLIHDHLTRNAYFKSQIVSAVTEECSV
jgi:hypothetical protein